MQYYRYVAELKRDGQPLDVTVLHADQHDYDYYQSTGSGRTNVLFYTYDATRDDFIAVGYAPQWAPALFPLAFWLIILVAFRAGPSRAPTAQPARP